MNKITDKTQILKFLKSHHTGVLSMIGVDAKPRGSVLYYLVKDGDIYIITRTETEKHKSIDKNPDVSFTVYSEKPRRVLHVNGKCEQHNDEAIFDQIIDHIARIEKDNSGPKSPPVAQLDSGDFDIFKIAVQNTHFTDYES